MNFKLEAENLSDRETTKSQLDCLTRLAGKDASAWARYSVAMRKVGPLRELEMDLSQHPEYLEERCEEVLRQVIPFLPQLLAIGCKSSRAQEKSHMKTS